MLFRSHAAKLAEMTALLKKEMERYADTAPLKVANPQPAEWSPPGNTSKGKAADQTKPEQP